MALGILRTKKDSISLEKLKDVDRRLSEMCAEDNFKIVKEACQGLVYKKIKEAKKILTTIGAFLE